MSPLARRGWAVLIALCGCAGPGAASPRGWVHQRIAALDAAQPLEAGADCAQLARAATARHPRVRAAVARGQAALARVDGAGTLAPPRATFEIWDFPIGQPSLADRDGMYMLGLSQEFPAWGVRSAQQSAATEDALAAAEDARATWLTTWRELAHACVDWSEAAEVVAQLGAHHGQLSAMREVAIARYAAGDSLSRLARIDAEASNAEMHVAEASAQLEGARAAHAALVDGLVKVPQQPPPLPAQRAIAGLRELTGLAADRAPRPAQADAMSRSAEHRAEASARAAALPSVEVRATWMQMPGQRAGLGAMVAIPLPWLWGRAAAEQRASAEDAAAAAEAGRDERRLLSAEVARAVARANALGRSLEVLETRVLPAAARAADAERLSFTAGSSSLIEWIEATHLAREALVDRARQRAQREHAWIDLEALTAAPLQEPREAQP